MWHIHYTYLSCQTFQYIPNTDKKNNTFSDSSHSKSLDLGGIYDWKNVNLIIKLQVYLFSSH